MKENLVDKKWELVAATVRTVGTLVLNQQVLLENEMRKVENGSFKHKMFTRMNEHLLDEFAALIECEKNVTPEKS